MKYVVFGSGGLAKEVIGYIEILEVKQKIENIKITDMKPENNETVKLPGVNTEMGDQKKIYPPKIIISTFQKNLLSKQ